MMTIKFKKLTKTAKLPTYAHAGDAGMDVYSDENYTFKPNETHLFTTGIASEFPAGYVALVWDKGRIGAMGIHHCAGVIDAGYRGEWFICLHNSTKKAYKISRGDKIAQVLIQKIEYASFEEAKILSESKRGTGQLGSTGLQ